MVDIETIDNITNDHTKFKIIIDLSVEEHRQEEIALYAKLPHIKYLKGRTNRKQLKINQNR